jgi:hypothetical protein
MLSYAIYYTVGTNFIFGPAQNQDLDSPQYVVVFVVVGEFS